MLSLKSLCTAGLAALFTLLITYSASATVLSTSDGVIRDSLCVGLDCPSSPAFSDSTILMMENNTRIKFDDTSTGGPPANDWEIEANSNLTGGASYIGFNDCGISTQGGCATNLVFAVEAGARASALYVESDGDIGIGTSNPAVDIHLITGNTPTLRLEQDTSSGFGAQVWDVAGNEANFFIRDVTNGSTLPFRIRPNAPTDSLEITAAGGIKVKKSGLEFTPDANTLAMFQNNAAANSVARVSILSGNTGVGQLAFGDAQNEFAGRIRYFHSDDHMDFLVGGNVEALRVFGTGPNTLSTATSTAVLTSAGVWQNASSRALKQNIHSLSADAAMDTLAGLKPVTFNYIKEPDETTVGFIAEDVPELVATASRTTLSSLDIVAVLTRVVQEQQQTIAALNTRLDRLETRTQN